MTRSLRICIVTADFVGPIRNGGIGTAYYNLAMALSRAGHHITVLYTSGTHCEDGTAVRWRRHYRKLNIDFVPLPPTPVEGHSAIKMAYGAYQWIKDRDFDVVHCHEWRAVGFCIALAKKQGLCLRNAMLVVGAHSPTLWCLEGMNELADSESLEVDFMERQSVAMAEVLWTPSRHMREWLTREGWTLPKRIVHEHYILHAVHRSVSGAAAPNAEIVFFGRLETRKGLDLFCDALDRLVARGLTPARVTFLGKISSVAGVASDAYLEARASRWPFSWSIKDTLDRDGAMAYLREPNRIAVLPSRLDNLPYTVLECLSSQIPFVASDIGGIPEMIRPADRSRVLFALTAESMANRLADVIRDGLAPAPLRVAPERTTANWLRWHGRIRRRPPVRPLKATTRGPLVSVCISTRNRPAFLDAALASIRAQTYSRLEVVVVDDGSDSPEAVAHLARLEPEFRRRKWQILRQPNRYVGAARNAAVRAARGEYLLFMDDDNLAEPHEVATFVTAARHSGADVLACFMRLFQSETRPHTERVWPFLGGALAPGIVRNVFGDANAFFRRSVFETIGGFHEEFGVSGEDWELLARAVLKGLRVEVVPEPLVRYRQSPRGMLQTTSQHLNHMRALRPYFQLLPAHLRPLVHLARGGRESGSAAQPAARLDHVRHAAVFGSGEAGRLAIDLADRCGWTVPYLVDNNPSMWNQTAHGRPVRSPDSLTSTPVDLVIVASIAGKPAISSQLEKMGLVKGEQFVHFLDPVRRGQFVTQVHL